VIGQERISVVGPGSSAGANRDPLGSALATSASNSIGALPSVRVCEGFGSCRFWLARSMRGWISRPVAIRPCWIARHRHRADDPLCRIGQRPGSLCAWSELAGDELEHVLYRLAGSPSRSMARGVGNAWRCSQMCAGRWRDCLGRLATLRTRRRDFVRQGRGTVTSETWAGLAHNPEVAGSNPAPAATL
jgi:hypothetical protein